MYRYVIIALMLLSTTAYAADKAYYQYPTQATVPDNARFLMYDPVTGSKNVVGSALKAVFKGNTSLATPTADGLMSKNKAAAEIYVDDYGAIGDGLSHTLAAAGYTLGAAQAKWPNVTITNINTNQVDWAALMQASYVAISQKASLTLGGKKYYISDKWLIDGNLLIKGKGKGLWTAAQNIDITTITGDYDGPFIEVHNTGVKLEDLAIVPTGTPGANQIGLLMGSDNTGPNFYTYATNVRFTNNRIGAKNVSNNFGGFDRCNFRGNYLGLYIDNTYDSDRGSGFISHCEFTDDNYISDYLLYVNQGSGWWIHDNDFLRGKNQIYINIPATISGVAETLFFIHDNSFEDAKGYNIYAKNATTEGANNTKHRLMIKNNETYNLSGVGVDAENIYIDGWIEVQVYGNILNNFGGQVTKPALTMKNGHEVGINHNYFGGSVTGISVESTVSNGKIGNDNVFRGVGTEIINNSASVENPILKNGKLFQGVLPPPDTTTSYDQEITRVVTSTVPVGVLHTTDATATGATNVRPQYSMKTYTGIYSDTRFSKHALVNFPGTVVTPTAAINGTVLGQYEFRSYDGTAGNTGALIEAVSSTGWSSSDNSTTIRFKANGPNPLSANAPVIMEVRGATGDVKFSGPLTDGTTTKTITQLATGNSLTSVTSPGPGTVNLAIKSAYFCTGVQTGVFPLTATVGDQIKVATADAVTITLQASASGSIYINGSVLTVNTGGTYTQGPNESTMWEYKASGHWQCDAKDKYIAGGGSVTSVTSANADIAVATTTTTPVLTLNSGISANQIVKLDANTRLGLGTTSPLNSLHISDTIVTANRGLLVSQHSADATNAVVFLYKSRGTQSSPTAVVTNDIVSGVVSKAYVGATNAYQTVSQILTTITGGVSDSNYGPAADVSIKTTDSSGVLGERLRITSAGATVINQGTNILYYCNAGANAGLLGRGNSGPCPLGAWVATSLTLD